MPLLFETANYSLHQLISVPEEKACTSMAPRWDVPSAILSAKQPIMDTTVTDKEKLKFKERHYMYTGNFEIGLTLAK